MNKSKRIAWLQSQLNYMNNKLIETRRNQIEIISKYDISIERILITQKKLNSELEKLKYGNSDAHTN